ncbi:hypothetical protein V6Z11_A01G120200 [Gossypium hirsutum]
MFLVPWERGESIVFWREEIVLEGVVLQRFLGEIKRRKQVQKVFVLIFIYLFIYFLIFFLFVRFIYFTNIFNKKNLQKKYKKGKERRNLPVFSFPTSWTTEETEWILEF